MPEDNTHIVTQNYSGSWKEKVSVVNGKIKYGDPYDTNPELFVDAECTCGKTFTDFNAVMEHINQYADNPE